MFMTKMSTLQSCPTSSLARMFSSPHQFPARDPSGAFLLDSSPAMFGFVLDWCRYNQLIVVRDNMDWSSLEVVADYFGLEEMREEVRRRKEEEMDKERQLKREKHEQYREMMDILVQLRQEVAQLDYVFIRGQEGGPGHPRFPPRFPGPGPEFPDPDYV